MERMAVESTVIASMGYDPRSRELEIEYRQTEYVYRYFEAPDLEYASFLAAESKGTYLNQAFKPQGYRYEIVRRV